MFVLSVRGYGSKAAGGVQPGEEGCGVGRGRTPVLLGAGDVGAGLLGALLSQIQPPEGSSLGSLERSSKKNK